MNYQIIEGDCLEVLPSIATGSVDCVICDPPYGQTACKWDSVIPFAPMWEQLKHVIKPKGAIVLFAVQPFASALVMSNPKWFKHEWIWDKLSATNPANSLLAPKRSHENILVFAESAYTYNPVMWNAGKPNPKRGASYRQFGSGRNQDYKNDYSHKTNPSDRYPLSVIGLPFQTGECNNTRRVHPTQKPVNLLRYLVRTYTNAGETILDFTIGSGSTGVAALLEGRSIIGIEKEAEYCTIARQRLEETFNSLTIAQAQSAFAFGGEALV